MTKFLISALGAAVLFATAAAAQTNPTQETNPAQQPDTQSGCPSAAMHNNMLPAIRPGQKPKSCDHKTPGAKPASAPSSTSQAAPTVPDQGKPGVRPSDNNTTKTHMPGSENQQDEGPSGAPK
ncbi:MAG TPA: hypothetical protein VGG36_09465 [Rhizomicrobium sp.]|jgi:hypothetical protein